MMETKWSRFYGVRGKLLLTLVCLSILVAAFTAFFSAWSAKDKVYKISTKLSEKTVEYAGAALAEYVDDLQNLSNGFMRSNDLVQIVSAAAPQSTSRLSIPAAAQLMGGSGSTAKFDFVSVFCTNGSQYKTYQDGLLPFEDYDACLRYWSEQGYLPEEDSYISSRWVLGQTSEGCNAIYLRFIYEPVTMNKIGIALFGIKISQLDQLYNAYGVQGFLVSRQGLAISSTASHDRGAILEALSAALQGKQSPQVSSLQYKDGSGSVHIFSYYSLWQLRAYLVVPFEYYETTFSQEMADYTRSVLVATLLALVMASALALFLSRGLTHSVTSLYDFTRKVEQGNTQLRFAPKTKDEIAALGINMNRMLDQLQLLAKQQEEDLMANQLMELQLMQQQINPHLLYNTLDSLLWVLEQQRVEDARQLVNALSEFFKISLSRGKDLITLGQELRLIRHYLDLQLLARNRHISLETDIEAGLETHPLIKLTLQPLVENAIIHGFSGYRENGMISIRAFRQGQTLSIVVRDNGIGLMEDEIQKVNEALCQKNRPEDFPHFGLYNINRRIIRSYGSAYGIRLCSELSAYTEVWMTLPYQQPKEEGT